MSAETPPLIFTKRLGMLAPANAAASEAVAAIEGNCVVKITRANRNQARRGAYWVITGIVTAALNDMHDLTLTEQDLHDLIRDKLGLYDETILPSGDVFRKRRSTADKAMAEPERAAFMDKAFKVYSSWLGVPVDTLLREARC